MCFLGSKTGKDTVDKVIPAPVLASLNGPIYEFSENGIITSAANPALIVREGGGPFKDLDKGDTMRKADLFVRVLALAVSMSVCFFFYCADIAKADAENDISSEEGAYRPEDMDKALDKAIKVLTVIREDLAEESKGIGEQPPADQGEKKDSAAATAGKWIARVNRMWKNVKAAVSDEKEGGPAETEAIDTKALSGRIGQAIDMMTAIRDGIEDENRAQEENNGK